jgi:hypothetical protein
LRSYAFTKAVGMWAMELQGDKIIVCKLTDAWFERYEDGTCSTLLGNHEKMGTETEVIEWLRAQYPI